MVSLTDGTIQCNYCAMVNFTSSNCRKVSLFRGKIIANDDESTFMRANMTHQKLMRKKEVNSFTYPTHRCHILILLL